jgi:hypothetical protein
VSVQHVEHMNRKQFLEVLFDADHFSTCGNSDAGATSPPKPVFPDLITDPGCKFSINPIIDNRDTPNVLKAGLYSMLFEMDKDSNGQVIPRDTQISLFQSSGLPYSTMMWSGTKSVHVIVRMERPIPELWFKPLWEAIAKVLTAKGCSLDPATKKIPQISRMPDSIRRDRIKDETGQTIGWTEGVRQNLIDVRKRVSAQELFQWLKENGETVKKPLPPKPFVPIKTDKSNLDKFRIARKWSEKKAIYSPMWTTGGHMWLFGLGVNLRKLECDLDQAVQFAKIEWGETCETGMGPEDITIPITKGWYWLEKNK